MSKKPIKIGVSQGSGPLPGYEWSVWILDVAFDEAMAFLKEEQYEHLALQMQELARHEDPTHSDVLSIRDMSPESFHELRDKGGVLNKLNVRVFYGIDETNRAIVVLGAITKQDDGPTPRGDVVRIRRRWRKYQAGDYGKPSRTTDRTNQS